MIDILDEAAIRNGIAQEKTCFDLGLQPPRSLLAARTFFGVTFWSACTASCSFGTPLAIASGPAPLAFASGFASSAMGSAIAAPERLSSPSKHRVAKVQGEKSCSSEEHCHCVGMPFEEWKSIYLGI